MRSTSEAIKKFLYDSVGYLSIVLLSVIYLAMTLFTFGETGKSVTQIIADGATFLLLGTVIARLFSLQGVRNGERSERFRATVEMHAQSVEAVRQWMDRLDAWCAMKTRETLRDIRTRILQRFGMSYDQFFTAEGKVKPYVPERMPADIVHRPSDSAPEARIKQRLQRDFELREKARYRAYRKAAEMHITPLTSGAITGLTTRAEDPYNFGKSTLQREAGEFRRSFVTRLITAGIFGYYGVSLIQDFSIEMLILRLFHVILAVAMGCVSMYTSYMYVVEEQRGGMVRKIDCLQMFEACMKRKENEKNGISQAVPRESVRDSGEARRSGEAAERDHSEQVRQPDACKL